MRFSIRFLKYFSYTIQGVLALWFLGSSIFFTVQVVAFKESLSSGNEPGGTVLLKNNAIVTVKKIIDADEVSVIYRGEHHIIRLLGIKSYDPKINDVSASAAGRAAFQYLKKRLSGTQVILKYDEYKLDKKQRLLAYIHFDNQDVGEQMVKAGLTLVYEKFGFSREKQYLQAEKEAQDYNRGIWSNGALANRSLMLKQLWRENKSAGSGI